MSGQTAEAKALGLTDLEEAGKLSGHPLKTLNKWKLNHPKRFRSALISAAVIKRAVPMKVIFKYALTES